MALWVSKQSSLVFPLMVINHYNFTRGLRDKQCLTSPPVDSTKVRDLHNHEVPWLSKSENSIFLYIYLYIMHSILDQIIRKSDNSILLYIFYILYIWYISTPFIFVWECRTACFQGVQCHKALLLVNSPASFSPFRFPFMFGCCHVYHRQSALSKKMEINECSQLNVTSVSAPNEGFFMLSLWLSPGCLLSLFFASHIYRHI